MARKKTDKNNDAIYFECVVSKVKNNKAFTIKASDDDFNKLAADMEKADAEKYDFYIKGITESIKYKLDNALKNCYLYISSKYPIKVVSPKDSGINANALMDITPGSEVTLKFVNGFVNMVRVDNLYNAIDDF